MMNGQELYIEVYKKVAECRERLNSAGVCGVYIVLWSGGYSDKDPYWEVKGRPDEKYTSKEETVSGKDLDMLVEELIRRTGFQTAQNNLQLAPPTIEAEAESKTEIVEPGPNDPDCF